MSNIIKTLDGINSDSFQTPEERKKAIFAAHAMLARIETPWDTALRLVISFPTQMAAIKIAYDMGLLQKWLEMNDGKKSSFAEIAGLAEYDPELLKRLLRHLAATHVLFEDAHGKYELTPFAANLVNEDLISMFEYAFQLAIPLCTHLPKFFKDINYKNPTGIDGNDCFTNYSGKNIWEFLGSNPEAAMNIGRNMKATGAHRGSFSQVFPCEGITCGKDEALVVDVGGSMGHDLQKFKSLHPNAAGRLVLQDKPDVVERAKAIPGADASIEKMAYDFFTPQPISGASIYLLHAVLHDWPDADAIRILKTLKPALKKGHSRLLIHEVVVPEIKANFEVTGRDWTMLFMASGLERTENQWKKLIDAAGYQIKKIWNTPLYAESVIEVELA